MPLMIFDPLAQYRSRVKKQKPKKIEKCVFQKLIRKQIVPLQPTENRCLWKEKEEISFCQAKLFT